MLADFVWPFVTIALAELGDKTQLSMMALSARHGRPIQIFLGAMFASVIVDGLAIIAGGYASQYFQPKVVGILAGAMFLVFGLISLAGKESGKSAKLSGRTVFGTAFALFFFSEFGDKSQAAALLFGTQYNLALSIAGTISAIAVTLAAMLAVGKYISKKVKESRIRVISGIVFIAIGLLTIYGSLT